MNGRGGPEGPYAGLIVGDKENDKSTRLKVLELAKLTIDAYGFSMVA